jgi:N-acetylmuramoyl-L-alanine amidase
MRLLLAVLVVSLATVAWGQSDDDPEVPKIDSASTAFVDSAQSSIQRLSDAGFEGSLETPTFGANADEIFNTQVKRIKSETPIPTIDELQKGTTRYDVIVQPGHYGRPPGNLGTHGDFVSEKALVAYIANVTARRLREDGLSVLIVSADKYPRPLPPAKVFLAIHAEGAENHCNAKASLAYSSGASPLAMHAVGWALSSALGYRYSDFQKDNYTPNERDYYMFRTVKADRLTGLVEVGELTCAEREKKLIGSSELIGDNIAAALKFIAQMQMANK